MIDHQLGDNAQSAFMRRGEKGLEIVQRAVVWINIEIIGDVVAIIFERRWIKWEEARSRSIPSSWR